MGASKGAGHAAEESSTELSLPAHPCLSCALKWSDCRSRRQGKTLQKVWWRLSSTTLPQAQSEPVPALLQLPDIDNRLNAASAAARQLGIGQPNSLCPFSLNIFTLLNLPFPLLRHSFLLPLLISPPSHCFPLSSILGLGLQVSLRSPCPDGSGSEQVQLDASLESLSTRLNPFVAPLTTTSYGPWECQNSSKGGNFEGRSLKHVREETSYI